MKSRIWRFNLELTHTWRIARGSGSSDLPVVLFELDDEAGGTGIGESAPIARYNESVETVEAFLQKVEPHRLSFTDIPGSMQYLETIAPGQHAAKCAVNIALLDGAAKAAGQSVHDFLKLGFTEGKHVTSFSIGIDKPDIIREKVREASAFPVLKLKVGSPDDEANFGALRDVAPSKWVRVDANEGWKTKEEALRRIEWLHRDGHVQFVEQPMPAATPVADWVWLKERSPLPIFADESYHNAADATRAAECFHGVNVKLVKTAGITGAYEALMAARRLGLKTMIGCMIETSVLISAAAHLAELADHLDIDGNILIKNDPYAGATSERGVISFARAQEQHGLRVTLR
ncbi:MAG: L-Ala-D/L-Glu epimerase [Verrucomicrobiota bacterium]|jgi:L-alanine-DL-glutamate epimerase-like enolase superfamily enzyme